MASSPVLDRITVPICSFMNTNSVLGVPCRTLLSRALSRVVHLALLRKFYTFSGLHLQSWRDNYSSNPVSGSQFSVESTPITGTKYMGTYIRKDLFLLIASEGSVRGHLLTAAPEEDQTMKTSPLLAGTSCLNNNKD